LSDTYWWAALFYQKGKPVLQILEGSSPTETAATLLTWLHRMSYPAHIALDLETAILQQHKLLQGLSLLSYVGHRWLISSVVHMTRILFVKVLYTCMYLWREHWYLHYSIGINYAWDLSRA